VDGLAPYAGSCSDSLRITSLFDLRPFALWSDVPASLACSAWQVLV
jgi:hypothetical protein